VDLVDIQLLLDALSDIPEHGGAPVLPRIASERHSVQLGGTVQTPYLGPMVGVYTGWTPLTDRPALFPEDIDTSDPWQFRNVLVHG
jgi:hypothetical protein